jgi:hypothetical protein
MCSTRTAISIPNGSRYASWGAEFIAENGGGAGVQLRKEREGGA